MNVQNGPHNPSYINAQTYQATPPPPPPHYAGYAPPPPPAPSRWRRRLRRVKNIAITLWNLPQIIVDLQKQLDALSHELAKQQSPEQNLSKQIEELRVDLDEMRIPIKNNWGSLYSVEMLTYMRESIEYLKKMIGVPSPAAQIDIAQTPIPNVDPGQS